MASFLLWNSWRKIFILLAFKWLFSLFEMVNTGCTYLQCYYLISFLDPHWRHLCLAGSWEACYEVYCCTPQSCYLYAQLELLRENDNNAGLVLDIFIYAYSYFVQHISCKIYSSWRYTVPKMVLLVPWPLVICLGLWTIYDYSRGKSRKKIALTFFLDKLMCGNEIIVFKLVLPALTGH